MKVWTHRVVKRMIGANGRWLDFPTAATFASEAAARDYAERFAAEQALVGGCEIDVRSRRGKCGYGRGAIVATYARGVLVRG
jgi:hypothetical protein